MVLYYSIVRTNVALCHTKYILVSTWIPKLLLVCTLTNLVCTWYVLGTNWYIHGKTKIRICITLGFEPWISCIATSAQYHYATSVYSTVIHGVNTRYIPTENATRVASYLLAGWCRMSGAGPAAPPAPGINLNFPDAHFGSAESAIDCP